MQRRVILLRRPVRVDHEIERVRRRAVDIDAAALHFLERAADRVLPR
jgi:hypothetical protein